MTDTPLPPANRRFEGASVLIVDDAAANLLALEALIVPLGCPVMRATSGAEAVELALQREFAVVLLDIMMPGMDGYETARLIRGRATHEPPIIFLTAGDVDGDRLLQSYRVGGIDLLTKPFDPVVVRSKVAIFCELYENTQQLRRQADLLRSREQMLAMVSHDLRAPLSTIHATTQLLARRTRQADPEDLESHLGRIQRSVEQMDRLLSDLLDLSRIDADKLTLEARHNDVGALARDAVELFQPVANTKQQVIDCIVPDQPAWAQCDEGRLLQVMSNLLTNATKYTPAAGSIRVEVTGTERLVTVSVIDTGPGLSSDDAQQIFEPFWQARHHARQGGTGLGLWIARRIVEAHGGRIWAEPTAVSGARVHFVLPRAESAARTV